MAHIFISYVRENQKEVDRLAADLRNTGVDVWLDREQIAPGQIWREAIRTAIREGAYFIACFSDEYHGRDKSYMNEELTLAIEELRQRPTNHAWFIPVLLSECTIPDRDIGAGQTLRDIQYVGLHSNWTENVGKILQVVSPQSQQLNLNSLTKAEVTPHLDIEVRQARFMSQYELNRHKFPGTLTLAEKPLIVEVTFRPTSIMQISRVELHIQEHRLRSVNEPVSWLNGVETHEYYFAFPPKADSASLGSLWVLAGGKEWVSSIDTVQDNITIQRSKECQGRRKSGPLGRSKSVPPELMFTC